MEIKYEDQQLIDFIAAKYHYSPHYKDGVDLEKTPLALCFAPDGDQGKKITDDPEIIEMHQNTNTEQELLEIVENTFRECCGD